MPFKIDKLASLFSIVGRLNLNPVYTLEAKELTVVCIGLEAYRYGEEVHSLTFELDAPMHIQFIDSRTGLVSEVLCVNQYGAARFPEAWTDIRYRFVGKLAEARKKAGLPLLVGGEAIQNESESFDA